MACEKCEHALKPTTRSLIYLHYIQSELKALKDTVNNAATLDVSVLGKVELDELPKATGVIVVHSLGVPKGLHDGAAIRGGKQSAQKGEGSLPVVHAQRSSAAVNSDPDSHGASVFDSLNGPPIAPFHLRLH